MRQICQIPADRRFTIQATVRDKLCCRDACECLSDGIYRKQCIGRNRDTEFDACDAIAFFQDETATPNNGDLHTRDAGLLHVSRRERVCKNNLPLAR
jgi:hypothetical protein